MKRLVWRWCAVVLWMGGIFALSAIPALAAPVAPAYDFLLRKLAHLVEYAGLTILVFRAVRLHVGHNTLAWVLAALVTCGYAVSDEWHQTVVPGREGSFRDVGIDMLGIAGACLLAHTGYVKA
jgi:VanZ family protein